MIDFWSRLLNTEASVGLYSPSENNNLTVELTVIVEIHACTCQPRTDEAVNGTKVIQYTKVDTYTVIITVDSSIGYM